MSKSEKIDSILMILKKSKSWKRKLEERNLDILEKRYILGTKINKLLKEIENIDFASNFCNSSCYYYTTIKT